MVFEEAISLISKFGMQLLADKSLGLTGLAVGRRDGGPIIRLCSATNDAQENFCITAFVARRKPEHELGLDGQTPLATAFSDILQYSRIPGSDKPFKVVESGDIFRPLSHLSVPAVDRHLHAGQPPILNTRKRFNALRPGISIANPFDYPKHLCVGTAGFFLEDDEGRIYLVSNNHVLARCNKASKGEVIVQPGTLDLSPGELIAAPTLRELDHLYGVADLIAYVELQFKTSVNTPHNTADAALAHVRRTANRDCDSISRLAYGGRIGGISTGIESDDMANPLGDNRVYKIGRTTGLTEGIVTAVGGLFEIDYGTGVAQFTNQMVVSATTDNGGPFGGAGDSGAVIMNEAHEILGLLFGGSPLKTLVNPIDGVIQGLRQSSGIGSLKLAT